MPLVAGAVGNDAQTPPGTVSNAPLFDPQPVPVQPPNPNPQPAAAALQASVPAEPLTGVDGSDPNDVSGIDGNNEPPQR